MVIHDSTAFTSSQGDLMTRIAVILGSVRPHRAGAQVADWVVALSHIWPLTWEFHFTRDIITRGADFMGYAATFGAFLIYIAVIGVLYTLRFYSAKKELLARDIEEQPAGTRLHLET